MILRLLLVPLVTFSFAIRAADKFAEAPACQSVGEQPDGSFLVSTNQVVTPVGKVERIEGARPKDLAVSPDGATIAVLTTATVLLYAPDGKLKGSVKHAAGPLGLAWGADSLSLFASGGGGQIQRVVFAAGKWKTGGSFAAVDPKKNARVFTAQDASDSEANPAKKKRAKAGDPQAAGLAVSRDGTRLYVALGISNAMKADERPYTHLPNKVPLDEMNPPVAALKGEPKRLAQACAKLDWNDVDRADFAILARAAWAAQRPGEPFPWDRFNRYPKGNR